MFQVQLDFYYAIKSLREPSGLLFSIYMTIWERGEKSTLKNPEISV